ncbi:hypothetical protein N0609_11865 [Pseudomonas aeruginosa]|nr:hypothetical protein [Pseudomonas aeruginosa]MCS8510311.1 hypothetical protein [Pseudomonas aeruginosa]MCS8541181.1 hypothetical protein [Pseudomonas aeruginosa]MCT0600327.1 hypothetical protein [Pseudomonas aeruginosa]
MNRIQATPEPMIRVSALGYTLGRNPDSMPHNIRPDMSLWNAPDGRELTYIQAQEEARFIKAYLVHYLVSGRYVLANIYDADDCRPAVFQSKEEALLFVQQEIIGRRSITRQYCIEGPGVDYHVPNTAECLKEMNYNLMPALRKTA